MAQETISVNSDCVHGKHGRFCTQADNLDSRDSDAEMLCLLLSEALRIAKGLGVSAPAPAPQPEPVPGASVEAPAPTHVAVPLVQEAPEVVAPAEVKEDRVEWPWFCVPEKRKELSKYIVINKNNLTGICKRVSNFAKQEDVPAYKKHYVIFRRNSNYNTFPAYFLQMVVDKLKNDPGWMREYRVTDSKQDPVCKRQAMLPGFFSVTSEMERLNKIFVFSEDSSKLLSQKNRIALSLAALTKKLNLSKKKWRGKEASGSWMYPYAAWEEFYRLVNTMPDYFPSIPRRTA